jgi:aminobenzoyl-glutamate transport protein
MTEPTRTTTPAPGGAGWLNRTLDWIERVGNRLPDPAILFFIFLLLTWACSALLAGVAFETVDPRTNEPIVVKNLLAGREITGFLSQMVQVFVNFPPLGVVLVAMLGIGVAEHTGFINAALRALLSFTSRKLLTPMLILVGIVSHSAVDAGYVLVIPIGGVIFYAAGRHPLAGIAAAFAGVSGGFSANFVPSALDPLLAGLTAAGAQVLDPELSVNPLNNYFFTTASSVLIIGLGWFLTDRVVEPRLQASTPVDGDTDDLPTMAELTDPERRALRYGLLSMLVGLVVLFVTTVPADSPWRDENGGLAGFGAPLMRSIVPLIFLLFLIPGIVYGYLSGTVKSHRDIIAGMTKSMNDMGYYLVMAFFAAQFIYAFGQSNLGALIAISGANWLKEMGLWPSFTLLGIILVTGTVNLLVGSASAKWALLAPILVPMLMSLGISPDLTQAAYRVGDSTTNIITPLMPYFPLIVVFCQRYFKASGIGTLVAMMLPYSVVLLTAWSLFLLGYWALGLPLGIQASYVYPPG